MVIARPSKSASIRAQLTHPVIDCDGHTLEFEPAFLDNLRLVGGAEVHDRYLSRRDRGAWLRWYRMSWEERRDHRAIRPPWWRVPTDNALDRATFVLPQLRYERMCEMGFDFAVIYPTYGLSFPHILEEELRRACCRAYNTLQAEIYGAYADRLAAVAIIPMNTPQEALEELEFAVKNLGLKCIMLAGHVMRPIAAIAKKFPEAARQAVWLDTFGLDSQYDYNPVWARCAELKVTPTFHSAGMGWGSRVSISNYVYNHIGHFAAAGDALCKSLIMGGVIRAFPDLKFAFLEGGVAWACSLFSDLLAHWEKRNQRAVDSYNPEKVDHKRLIELGRHFGGKMLEGRWEQLADKSGQMERAQKDASLLNEWAACGVERGEDIREIFANNLYFGCEADDRMNVLAFNTKLNPFGARLNAIFSSDIGHWDVTDITSVVAEAFEFVEKNLLTEEDFRDFTFTNPVTFLTGANPEFFRGTVLEKEVDRLIADRRESNPRCVTTPASVDG